MFNPKLKNDIAQLSKAVGYSREKLKVFRQNRLKVMRDTVGRNYSNDGSPKKVPIPLIELAMNIYLQRLVAKAPRASITTEARKLKDICSRFEIAGNRLIDEIDLGQTLELGTSGAMTCKGIVKVGLNRTKIEVGGILHDAGQPFADFVGLDDWVEDMTAKRAENQQYKGNYWSCTEDEAVQLFPKKADKLIPQSEQVPEEENDHSVSEGLGTQREEFRQTIRCLDLWLPKQNLILQHQATNDETDPLGELLNVVEWDGPERGPYHELGFSVVENNTMPLAPAMLWRDLHGLANTLFRKLGRQAERQKTILGVQAGSQSDGTRVIETNDGEATRMDNPNSAKEYNFGGIKPETLAFLLAVKDLFGYFAGNLDMLGGLGPQSETLGQDQLLSASASMRMQKMQKSVLNWTHGIIKDLFSYLWYDPYDDNPVTKRVKGFEYVTVTVPFGPEQRESDFLEYNIKIEPYSMQYMTPEAKMQGLRTIFAEFVSPLIPMMVAQGAMLDIEALFRKIAKLSNIEDLNDIIVYASPNHEPQMVGEMTAKAPVTTRNYTRRSIPGATNQGKTQIMMQALLGGKPQNSEMASLTRATG